MPPGVVLRMFARKLIVNRVGPEALDDEAIVSPELYVYLFGTE